MGILGIFGGKVYRLRRKYDRVREKADRLSDRSRKLKALHILDGVETTLVTLEEQKLTRFDRRRMIFNVREGVEQAKTILKRHEEYGPLTQSQMRGEQRKELQRR
jgi:hypothetical protein